MTGYCGGPSTRTSWLNTCSQRQGDAKLVRASGQVPGAPCTTCVVWGSWDPLWLAFIEHLGGHTHEVLEGHLVLVSELHQKLIIEAKLSSPSDPWSYPDTSFSSSPPSSYEVNCQIDQIILVLENSYLHPLSLDVLEELKKISK